ncbi:hypothetical protein NPIL_228271 [Nephila pilipes]|uniref:Uncharacterized protein n=1 Tax=Nephila pilipes TaxID=299642 RepID=A0A8X6MZI1_NEPPI|nr:hypothetical protein NPIL_228271 [Nephila pilipes]
MAGEVLHNQHGRSLLTLHSEILNLQTTTKLYLRLAGDVGVGKSTLVMRLDDLHGDTYDETTHIVKLNRDYIELTLADLPSWRRPGRYVLVVDFEPAPFPEGNFVASFETSVPLLGAILFCINVSNRQQIESVTERAFLYRNHFQQNLPPCILVGTQIELRNDSENCISTTEGHRLARQIRANRYMECSAWEKIRTRRLFLTILDMLL